MFIWSIVHVHCHYYKYTLFSSHSLPSLLLFFIFSDYFSFLSFLLLSEILKILHTQNRKWVEILLVLPASYFDVAALRTAFLLLTSPLMILTSLPLSTRFLVLVMSAKCCRYLLSFSFWIYPNYKHNMFCIHIYVGARACTHV